MKRNNKGNKEVRRFIHESRIKMGENTVQSKKIYNRNKYNIKNEEWEDEGWEEEPDY